jgi:hypothetical protein
MTRPLKKNRERFFAEVISKLLGQSWVLGLDREVPDFLVTERGQQFGLEVCKIFTGRQDRAGSAEKEMESHSQRTVDALRREYEAITNIPLIVKLVGDMCDENLALVVPAVVAEDLPSKPFDYQAKIDLNTGLHAGLRVHVTKALRPNWFSMKDRVGFVDRNPMSRIVSTVKKKAEKLSQYREAANPDIRLLIVADHINNSGKLMLEEQASMDLQGFAVVYFYPYPSEAVTIFKSDPSQWRG